jgi:hypothetical protein
MHYNLFAYSFVAKADLLYHMLSHCPVSEICLVLNDVTDVGCTLML